MGRAVWLVVVLGARSAVADDGGLTIRTRSELGEPGPQLTLDPMLRTQLEGLVTDEERHATTVTIGPVDLVLEGARWVNDDRVAEPHSDLAARGWRTALRVGHDLGFARIEAYVARSHVDMRYGRGTHRDAGVSLSRTIRLSRWMTAWISLDVGLRRWEGDKPPAGEANDETIMLRVGTTFR